eukprot:9420250-Pyramimonas_sp.AAC.1
MAWAFVCVCVCFPIRTSAQAMRHYGSPSFEDRGFLHSWGHFFVATAGSSPPDAAQNAPLGK